MEKDYAIKLATLFPVIIHWIEEQEKFILNEGRSLSENEMSIAKTIGIQNPEKVKILKVKEIPMPSHKELKKLMQEVGFVTSNAAGLGLRYGIFIIEDTDKSTVPHELVHTLQYERLGGIEAFMNQYIKEFFAHGYYNAPLEKEARTVATKVIKMLN